MTGLDILNKELNRSKTWDIYIRFITLDGKFILFDKIKYRYNMILKGNKSLSALNNENAINLAINDNINEAVLTLEFPFAFDYSCDKTFTDFLDKNNTEEYFLNRTKADITIV